MRMQRIRWTVGALALFGFVAVSGASHASCTGSNRQAAIDSYCLTGEYTNTCEGSIFGGCVKWSSSFWAEADEDCVTGTDKVVVKIDIAHATDKTWHQTNTDRRSGTASKRVNGVYCCKDLGRCDHSD